VSVRDADTSPRAPARAGSMQSQRVEALLVLTVGSTGIAGDRSG
jgi:hypothetical protein